MKEYSLGKKSTSQRELKFKKEKENLVKDRYMLYLSKPWYRSEKIPGVTING